MESGCFCHLNGNSIVKMLNKQITCTALAMILVMSIKAQSFGEIHGNVVDEKGAPIVGVVMLAENGVEQISYSTDSLGKFRLKALKAGEYKVSAFMMSYDTLQIKNVEVMAEKMTFLKNLVMHESAGVTGIVDIVYKRPELDPLNGSIVSLGAADLEHNAAIGGGNINQLLISMTPEIKASPNGEELYFRGSRAGSVIYFIDGMKVTTNNVHLPASGLSRVSVYTGGLPAKYGDTTGGVVVIESKSYLEDYYKKLNR